ncbi:unnamed protein product [Clonostachys rhizophaga]|uniref:SGNH hydrolase-type esterase domain-containing protein n=1 Tax=Clonostachys rhizophaga TaxID=160324 RepID=A0A9N9YR06_9HYPO|nr:unnamed protein product [Clonostachys rhizophaga]
MVALFQAFLQLLISSIALASAKDLRIMPLGASITFGVGSSQGNGYREFLRESLQGAGYKVTYVGSQHNGPMTNNDNEGFPGLRISQVLNDHAKTDVPTHKPNLYTINVGTNDAVQNFKIDEAGKRMDELLDFLWTATPDANVVLSTLVRNKDANTDARVVKINKQFEDLVSRRKSNGNTKIALADMHGSDGPQDADINSDGTHPNDTGFKKMSNIWLDAIKTVSGTAKKSKACNTKKRTEM